MTLLTLADAHLAYGHRPLLDGAALALADGERVALVGGSLQIESRPGAGTTLFVRIPLDLAWTMVEDATDD